MTRGGATTGLVHYSNAATGWRLPASVIHGGGLTGASPPPCIDRHLPSVYYTGVTCPPVRCCQCACVRVCVCVWAHSFKIVAVGEEVEKARVSMSATPCSLLCLRSCLNRSRVLQAAAFTTLYLYRLHAYHVPSLAPLSRSLSCLVRARQD